MNTAIAMIKMTKTMMPITTAAIMVFSELCRFTVTPVGWALASGALVGADVVSLTGLGVCPLHVW